jgi:hypothetical protein
MATASSQRSFRQIATPMLGRLGQQLGLGSSHPAPSACAAACARGVIPAGADPCGEEAGTLQPYCATFLRVLA